MATEAQRHRENERNDRLTQKIIGCAIEVPRHLGPGLLESTYESALCIEMEETGLCYQRQVTYPAIYRGRTIGDYRLDLIVDDAVIVELKRVERLNPVFEAQILTYLRITGKKLGLLINFNSRSLKDGIRRFIL